jgi:hypothetical protein
LDDVSFKGAKFMNEKTKLPDVVALTIDLAKYNLLCGKFGTVVETLR